MVQVTRTTSTASYPGVANATFSAQCDTLLSTMFPGQVATAAHLEGIRSQWNTFVQHNHSVTDQSWLLFGNTSPHPTTIGTTTTSGVSGSSQILTAVGSGTLITATLVTSYVTAINQMVSPGHAHIISDVTAP